MKSNSPIEVDVDKITESCAQADGDEDSLSPLCTKKTELWSMGRAMRHKQPAQFLLENGHAIQCRFTMFLSCAITVYSLCLVSPVSVRRGGKEGSLKT